MTDVTDTQGTKLRRSGVNIPNIKSIGAVGIGRALRDVTALSDANHKQKLNIPDVPAIAVEVWYDPQEPLHQLPMQDEVNASLLTWQIDIEQGNSPEENVTFTALVFGCEVGPFEVDGDILLKFSLKPQSVPVGLFE